MIQTYFFAALALVLGGVGIGILTVICLGIKRDDRPGGFPAYTSDLTARAARRVTGVGTRGAEVADEVGRRQDLLSV